MTFTQDEAQALFDHLASERFDAALSFSYTERMAPSEHYRVWISWRVGRFAADRLRRAMEISDEHDADMHLLGDGLVFFKKDPKLEARRRVGAA